MKSNSTKAQKNKMFIKEFVTGTYVADVSFIYQKPQFEEFIQCNSIKAVYLAPTSSYTLYKDIIVHPNVYPFNGGFMENSLALFSLSTATDISYFEKITEIKYTPNTT